MTPSIIKTTGQSIDFMPANGTDYTLEELQKAVGGYIEIVHLSDSQIMVVNEEGKLHDLDYNHMASLILLMATGARDQIVGNVVVCYRQMVK